MRILRRKLSVRLWLTLWGVGVLGIALLALGVAVRVTVRAYLLSSIDHELSSRANLFAKRGPFHPGGPPGEHGGPPEGGWGEGPRPLSPNDFAQGLFLPEWARTHDHGPLDRRPAAGVQKDDPYFPRAFDRTGNALRSDYAPWDTNALRLALSGSTVLTTVRVAGEPIRVCSVPLRQASGEIDGVVQFPLPLTQIEQGFAAVDRTLLMLLPLALIVTVSGGVLLTSRALRPIEQALEQEKRFVADASHELRTPITIIRAAVELGLEVTDNGNEVTRLRRSLERIGVAAERTRRIVDDLMLLARAERAAEGDADAGFTLALEPVSAFDLLNETATLFEPVREGRTITVDVAPTNLMLLADRHHLGRVVSNLLDNAVRHTRPQAGTVRLSARTATGGRVMIAVDDDGEGIPAADLPHLFRRFYRPDAARGRARGGAGLGLSIARAVVEAHHGRIDVESAPRAGTHVFFTVPLARRG